LLLLLLLLVAFGFLRYEVVPVFAADVGLQLGFVSEESHLGVIIHMNLIPLFREVLLS
jgi:hypothetical protein